MLASHLEAAPAIASQPLPVQRSTALHDVAVYPPSLIEIGRGTRVQGPTGDRPTLLCVLSGTAQITLEGAGIITVPSGSAVLIPARINAMIEHHGRRRKADPVDSVALLPRGELPRTGSFCPAGEPLQALVSAVTYEAPESGQGKVLHIDLMAVGNLRFAFSAMCVEIAEERPGVRLLAGALLKTCLVHLHRLHFPDGVSQAGASRTAAVIATMRANPGAAYNVETLARDAGMSRSSFARHFQRETGMSPMAFVYKVRLSHAATMLHGASTSIKIIAAECGFASRSHFSRAFREAYGDDPSAFRRKGRNDDSA